MERDFGKLCIGVVGIGLIGGSIARALRPLVGRIAVVDSDIEALRDASLAGIADEWQCGGYDVLGSCDVVFVATPVEAAAMTIAEVLRVSGALVTDTCSVKAPIMDAVAAMPGAKRFIGSHPMAGSHRSGFRASSDLLLENAAYVICPPEGAAESDIELLSALVRAMRAIPIIMGAEEHDRAVALISHLPHVAAAALAAGAADSGSPYSALLAAGGFRDMTRIAASSPELWAGIALQSRKELVPAIEGYVARLTDFKERLLQGDFGSIRDFFEKARMYRESLQSGGASGAENLLVDIPDRPGAIAAITGVLGENGINIRYISIENNREYEGGVLRMTLGSRDEAERAEGLLRKRGFEARKIH